MYMNNRAAETLAQGRLDEAYAWAREAVLRDPDFMSGYNTLGVIYRRRGLHERAEAVFRRVLERDRDNIVVLANLARLLQTEPGRAAEAAELAQQLARIETTPPFHDYQLGREAMARGEHAAARRHFARQIERTPHDPEFHFWLAQAEYALGDMSAARQHLTEALRNSASQRDQDLYAAKLDRMRGLRSQ
jgi:tetratricopeptide (TPR) repeat protein